MLDAKEIANIVTSVLFVASFLGIFFFTYAVHIEEQVVKAQIQYIVQDLRTDLDLLPEEQLNAIKQKIKQIKKPDLTGADEEVAKLNKATLWNAIKIITIAFVIGMISVYAMSRYYDFSMWDIIKKNLIILVFIALTEFVFLTVFGQNFISADPNYVKLTILNKLYE